MPVKVVGLVELKEKKSIAGHYQVSGSNLIREGCHLVIGTRKPEPNKSKNYLLERVPGGKPPHRYISSLYPVKNAPVSPQGALWFDFDYQGRYYTLEIDQATREAEIKEKGVSRRGAGVGAGRSGNSANPNNIAELGSKNDPGPDLGGSNIPNSQNPGENAAV